MNTTLLLVDVQNDFHPGGSLAIPSADKDAERIASFISNNRDAISRIVATLDTHHELHIANSGFWVDESGTHPSPFTLISAEDIETGKWKPITGLLAKSIYDETEGGVDPKILDKEGIFDSEGELILTKYCAEYAKQLESTGTFQLCQYAVSNHNLYFIGVCGTTW